MLLQSLEPYPCTAHSRGRRNLCYRSKTITSGPGGCLSVQPGGRPKLLIFNTDTRFSDHPPQVTLGKKTIKIGERFSLNAIEVSSTDLTGIPDKCSNGAADRAWIVGTK